jgi:hypothetical protein
MTGIIPEYTRRSVLFERVNWGKYPALQNDAGLSKPRPTTIVVNQNEDLNFKPNGRCLLVDDVVASSCCIPESYCQRSYQDDRTCR